MALAALAATAGAALWLAPPIALASSGSGSDGAVDDKIDDKVEDQVDAEAEAQVEDSVEDQVEDQVEDEVQDQVEDNVEDSVEDSVEDNVEDSVEDNVEDSVEDSVEDGVEDNVESDIEDSVDDDIEGDVEDGVEDNVEDRVESRIEDGVESHSGPRDESDEQVEDRIETSAVESGELAKDAFDLAEEQAKLEFDAARDAADAQFEAARDAARLAFETAMMQPGADADALKSEYELAIEIAKLTFEAARTSAESTFLTSEQEIRTAEDESGEAGSGSSGSGGGSGDDDGDNGDDESGSNSGSGSSKTGGDDDGKSGGDDDDHSGKGSPNSGSGGDDHRSGAGEAAPFEIAYDEDGNEIGRGEWLILAPQDAVGALAAQGYAVTRVEALDGLGLALVRLEAPANFSLTEAEAAIRAAAPDADIDYNHLYHASAERAPRSARGDRPAALLKMPKGEDGRGHAIGVIDTNVDLTHPALRSANLHVTSFVGQEGPAPLGHGTSVVSILAGAAPDYKGLLPQAEIFAASVFFVAPNGAETATTVGLVRALDWMTAHDIAVVNMSLAGPDNAILHRAIESAYAQGTIVVAAVGNAGPAAKPLYPAGYDHVVAVTAVSRAKKIYRLANRGDYVDFAAPGVDVLHAAENGVLAASSGTSMASPFVAAVLAVASDSGGKLGENTLSAIAQQAEDLGEKGFDPVFGYGLIKAPAN